MSLISPNSDVKLIIFPNFGKGPFPKIAEKGPEHDQSLDLEGLLRFNNIHV